MTEVLTRVFFASSTLLGAVAAVYVIVHVIDKGFSVLSELWTRNKSIMLETYVFDNSYYAEVNKQYPHLTD